MNTKKCPYCSEEILIVAKKCKHCGEWFGNVATEVQKRMMECPFCSEKIEEGLDICPVCKEPFAKEQEKKVPEKKKRTVWKILSIIAIAWIALAIVVNIAKSFSGKYEEKIVGSYSYTKTEDSEDGVFVTINGKCRFGKIFNEYGAYKNSGTMIMTVIDDDGDKSTLKYKLEVNAKYKIKDKYIIYDIKPEDIEITQTYSDDRELSKIMRDHFIPQVKHDMVVENREKILELNDKYLKTEEEYNGETITMTYIRQ